MGRRTTWGGRHTCNVDVQVGSIPTRSTKSLKQLLKQNALPLEGREWQTNSFTVSKLFDIRGIEIAT